jgi:hypothetical protein
MAAGPFLTQGCVKIARSQTHQKSARKPTSDLAAARAAGHKRNAPGAILFLYFAQSLSDLSQHVVPADGNQLAISALERLLQPLPVMLVVCHVKSFAANITL